LLIQGRTSGLVGLLVLLVWLLWDKGFAVTVVRAFASKVGESDVTNTVETIVHNWSPAQRLIGAWAILIGAIRGFAAIRLRQEAIGLLLMGTSGALLVLAGILLLPQHVWSWDLLGFVLFTSGISLVAVALLGRRGPP
jgi:hypothetical protein